MWVRTTNSSSGSPSHAPVLRISSVNERTCVIESSVMYFVLTAPGGYRNLWWRYRCRGGIALFCLVGMECSSNESSQSYGVNDEKQAQNMATTYYSATTVQLLSHSCFVRSPSVLLFFVPDSMLHLLESELGFLLG